MDQVKYSFDKATLIKIAKGAAIAGGAALAYYLLTALSVLDYGPYTAAVVAVLSILINVVKEYRAGN